MHPNKTRSVLSAVVLVHFAIVMLHGAAHTHQHIELASAEMTYVVAGDRALAADRSRAALDQVLAKRHLLFTISMSGALIFGGYKHFLSVTNDNVAQMQHVGWGGVFLVSSILLFVTEAAGVLLGFRAAVTSQAEVVASSI